MEQNSKVIYVIYDAKNNTRKIIFAETSATKKIIVKTRNSHTKI
jgi:hypothetical protein